MTKEELKDEMKNRISMALKDPILQQGFEIICKNLAKLESRNDKLVKMYNEVVERQNSFQQSLYKDLAELEKENAELKNQLEMSNKVYNDNLDYSHHIEELLRMVIDSYSLKERFSFEKDLAKAEQFLNSEEEK